MNERPIKKGLMPGESVEKGGNVTIDLTFQRHGIREGNLLTDAGRDITRAAAEESGKRVVENPTEPGEFHAAKAYGSPAGTPEKTPENPNPMGRALETASITSNTIAGDRAGEWTPRTEAQLNYESLKVPPPYDHLGIYNPALAEILAKHGKEKLTDCTPDEKAAITQEAQMIVIGHFDKLNTPEALAFKRESAGMFADLVEHYVKMATRLNSGSRVALTLGSHGSTVEHLVQQAAVWTDADGKEHKGFDSIEAFGGGFDSSEAYTVEIKTDANKELTGMTLTFANPNRPQGPMRIDIDAVHQLAADYRNIQKAYEEGGQDTALKRGIELSASA